MTASTAPMPDDWSASIEALGSEHEAHQSLRDPATGAMFLAFTNKDRRDSFEAAFTRKLGYIQPFGDWDFVVSETPLVLR